MSEQRIFLSSPDVGRLEQEMVLGAIRSGWVAPLGPDVDAFESELASRCGIAFAVALSSGTAALHIALMELGARIGTVVIVPTLTFAATAFAVAYTGASPVFVDCDTRTGNIDPDLLQQAITELRTEGRTIAAVIAVDLLGQCADYTRILPICETAGIPVLSDAAESLGARHANQPAGSFGVAAALSFNGNKVMTTSGGGALLTDDRDFANRARYLATQARQPVPHYEHIEVGYNYRMSNLLAALGRAQLQRLDGMINRRRSIRRQYAALFDNSPGAILFQRPGDEADNCWLTAIVVDPETAGWSVADLSSALADADIESRPLWKPMHRQPVFEGSRSFLNGGADLLFANGLALPSGSVLTDDQVQRVVVVIEKFLAVER